MYQSFGWSTSDQALANARGPLLFYKQKGQITGDEKRVRQISLLRIEILHIDFLNYILFL
jgi:hypothetical protein